MDGRRIPKAVLHYKKFETWKELVDLSVKP